jgi:hypothetical protein
MLIPLGFLAASGVGFVDAFEHIATATGTGASNTIEFTSIPADYKHLEVRFVAKNSSSANFMNLRMNNITTVSYSRHQLFSGSTTVSSRSSVNDTSMELDGFVATSSGIGRVSGGVIDILDYASTSKNTTVKALCGQTDITDFVTLTSGLLNNTAAIDRLTFISGADSFTTLTRFSLYGIKG